jgi:peptidoglycan/xylan/chitin deacetylase (PgdA/CDA1 family)
MMWQAEVLLLIAGTIVLLSFLVFWIQPLQVLGALERITPNVKFRVRTNLPLVALSFDDGPHPRFTRQVLKILKQHDARATFFLSGERALRYPEVVAEIKSEGHEVANHYFKDGSTLIHSGAKFLNFLEKTEQAIGPLKEPKLFRPPGGVAWPWQSRCARDHGYACVLGCAYPHDPVHPPVWFIKWLIKKNLRNGTIVILHDGISNPTRNIEALPDILVTGRQRGLRFVSIGELERLSKNTGE